MPHPLCSANPKTRQELLIYIWLIFPWPVSPDPRKQVAVPLHKLLHHFSSHHRHLGLSLSVYMKAEIKVSSVMLQVLDF